MALLLEEQFLPAILSCSPMSDEEFASFCAEHPDLCFEMTAEGELLVMPPNYTLSGIRNQQIGSQLLVWASQDGRGMAADSSSGFVLPNGARRSPDAAWISKVRVRGLEPQSLDRFWHLCPEFVIELRSAWDRLPVLRAKMAEWIANGAELGWLIDADERTVEVFRPGRESEVLRGQEVVDGEGPVAGFRLDLRRVWDPLG
jgi:Uma2 family endonuclease